MPSQCSIERHTSEEVVREAARTLPLPSCGCSNTSVVSPSPTARRSLLTLWWRNPPPLPPPSSLPPPSLPSCVASDRPLPVCRERSVNQRTLHLPQLRCLHSTEKRGGERDIQSPNTCPCTTHHFNLEIAIDVSTLVKCVTEC